jgi:hypothetical protein
LEQILQQQKTNLDRAQARFAALENSRAPEANAILENKLEARAVYILDIETSIKILKKESIPILSRAFQHSLVDFADNESFEDFKRKLPKANENDILRRGS